MRKKRIAIIIAGLSLSWVFLLTGLLQIDTMFWDVVEATSVCPKCGEPIFGWNWIPQLGLSVLGSFQLMFALVCLAIPTLLVTWFAASKVNEEGSEK